MNREILFRGKRVDNGKWLYGYYVYNSLSGRHFIMDTPTGMSLINSDEVHPATVGQFTGLLDKDGKKIFEGDIISFLDGYWERNENGGEFYEEQNQGDVFYNPEYARFEVNNIRDVELESLFENISHIEVIGNIHETTQSNEQSN